MKNNRFGFKSIGFILGMSALLIGAGTTASASTWHQGTPKILHGYWQTKVLKNGNQDEAKVSNHYVRVMTGGPVWLDHIKYRSIGHHTYRISGQYTNSSQTLVQSIHVFSKNHIALILLPAKTSLKDAIYLHRVHRNQLLYP